MKKIQETITIFVNRHPYCYPPANCRKIAGAIFALFISQLHLMSIDALRAVLVNAIEMLKEIGILDRHFNRVMLNGLSIADRDDRIGLMTFISNVMLAGEGSGLLGGFGMATYEKAENGGRRIKGPLLFNPEKRSIYTKI